MEKLIQIEYDYLHHILFHKNHTYRFVDGGGKCINYEIERIWEIKEDFLVLSYENSEIKTKIEIKEEENLTQIF